MSDPGDDSGVNLDPSEDWPSSGGSKDESTTDHEAGDAGAVLPGAGDEAGLDDMSVDDVDEP